MEKNKINLNFHQTFKPEKQYLSALLGIADGNYYTVKMISNMTGIPCGESSGKVEPHIFYASYMNLICFEKKDGAYKLCRTSLGNLIFSEDIGFQEELTILLCHCLINNPKKGADIWQTSFTNIFPRYHHEIKKELFYKELFLIYGDKVNKKNIAPFLNSYDDMFSLLNILVSDDYSIKFNSLNFNKDYIYLYAYVLYYFWDLYYSEDEITSLQLETIKYKEVFCWDNEQLNYVLEILSDKGIIRMNKQLMPFTILKLTKTKELEDRLYSLLF